MEYGVQCRVEEKKKLICQFCRCGSVSDEYNFDIGVDCRGRWYIARHQCHHCDKFNIVYRLYDKSGTNQHNLFPYEGKVNINKVPDYILSTYLEACATLSLSPSASATLSRKALQAILREHGYNQYKLIDQIKQASENNLFPSYISELIDLIRDMGNMGAHPCENYFIELSLEDAQLTLEILEDIIEYLDYKKKAVERKKEFSEKKEASKKKE